MRLNAIVSWEAVRESESGNAWLLEVSVRGEADPTGAWFAWEPAATIDASESSHILPIEPGLAYRFRLARLSNIAGQMPFSEPSQPVSALGDPTESTETISGCYVPNAAEAAQNMPAEAAAAAEAMPWDFAGRASAPSPPPAADAMPWDSPGFASATPAPPPAASAATDVRSDVWAAGEAPLLRAVPTSAELALLQAQASVVAAVRSGEKRLRVEVLPPGLNKMIEGSHAYSEPLLGYVGLSLAAALRGLSVQTIFPSAGTAAGAASSYKRAMGSEVGAHVSLGGFSGAVTRDLIAEGIDFTAK